VVEAQFLPVCDVAIRDAQLVGLADPYVTIKVISHHNTNNYTLY
jgi:hypothetical protein